MPLPARFWGLRWSGYRLDAVGADPETAHRVRRPHYMTLTLNNAARQVTGRRSFATGAAISPGLAAPRGYPRDHPVRAYDLAPELVSMFHEALCRRGR